jgi:hypothetical protein
VVLLMALGVLASSCSKHATSPRTPLPASVAPRTYHMGFSDFPPELTTESVLADLAAWSPRADEAIFHVSPDWAAMLSGLSADSIVKVVHLPVADYYRAHGQRISVTIDITNGLDRSAEDPALVTLHRSLTEPAIQQLYRDYALAVWRRIHPEHMALAAEVNLVRALSPAPLYAAVRQAANAAAADLRADGCTAVLSVSVQNEYVWGRDIGNVYRGPAADLADFPFMQEVPLSSYPYLGGFETPEAIPLDYYARVGADAHLPVRVVEGGWASVTLGAIASSPAEQARYIRRQMALLDSARANAVFQLDYTDLDLASYPQPQPAILPLFATLGLVDTAFVPKPARAAWDSACARPFRAATLPAMAARRR